MGFLAVWDTDFFSFEDAAPPAFDEQVHARALRPPDGASDLDNADEPLDPLEMTPTPARDPSHFQTSPPSSKVSLLSSALDILPPGLDSIPDPAPAFDPPTDAHVHTPPPSHYLTPTRATTTAPAPEDPSPAPSHGAASFVTTEDTHHGPSSAAPATTATATATAQPHKRRPTTRRYARRVPSRYCHICQRTERASKHIVCANIAKGACRKVVCTLCFTNYGWSVEEALRPGAEWKCTHCRESCPDRAQCYGYKRRNVRSSAVGK